MFALTVSLLLQADAFTREPFEKHIRFLASDEMKGRDNGTPEGLRAAQYVADGFKERGLKPAGKDGYFQDFETRTGRGRNVIGLVEGENRKEFVVVAAHHDARGVVDGKIQNGADDNASGVAMVLELARAFAGSRPARSMLFISFDAEEDGLAGSREFIKSELYDAAAFAACFVFDLVGGDFHAGEQDRFYALGSESSAELHERIGKAAGECRGLEVVRAGVFLLEPFAGMARSDYGPFRGRQVPFVFFSSGTPWYYHTEHDDPEIINYSKLVRAAGFVRDVIAATVADPRRPVYRPGGASAEDVSQMRLSLRRALDLPGLSEDHRRFAQAALAEVEAMKDPDAAKLQQTMTLLFRIARSQGKK